MVVLQSSGWVAAPFGYFQYRGHGGWEKESTLCHPSGCSELAAWMHGLRGAETLCSWEGRAEAKKARPVKPKGIGPELGRDAYFAAWEEHKVKLTFYFIGLVPSTSPIHWLHWRRYSWAPTRLEKSPVPGKAISLPDLCISLYAKLGL